MSKNRSLLVTLRLTAILLVIASLIPIGAGAFSEEMPEARASEYLSTYGAYVYAAGSGKVQVWFDVQGTGDMDELGALSIQIYECSTNSTDIDDWTWKKTFTHDSTADMLAYNDYLHVSHVDYSGTTGKYYKAYVCVWAGKNGDGDTRYFWTSAKKAT